MNVMWIYLSTCFVLKTSKWFFWLQYFILKYGFVVLHIDYATMDNDTIVCETNDFIKSIVYNLVECNKGFFVILVWKAIQI